MNATSQEVTTKHLKAMFLAETKKKKNLIPISSNMVDPMSEEVCSVQKTKNVK